MHRSVAPEGADSRRKWVSEPNDETRVAGRPITWDSQSRSWHDLDRSRNVDSSVRRQLPRTNEWAKCQKPTGSRCCTATSSPIRPLSSNDFSALVYGV